MCDRQQVPKRTISVPKPSTGLNWLNKLLGLFPLSKITILEFQKKSKNLSYAKIGSPRFYVQLENWSFFVFWLFFGFFLNSQNRFLLRGKRLTSLFSQFKPVLGFGTLIVRLGTCCLSHTFSSADTFLTFFFIFLKISKILKFSKS